MNIPDSFLKVPAAFGITNLGRLAVAHCAIQFALDENITITANFWRNQEKADMNHLYYDDARTTAVGAYALIWDIERPRPYHCTVGFMAASGVEEFLRTDQLERASRAFWKLGLWKEELDKVFPEDEKARMKSEMEAAHAKLIEDFRQEVMDRARDRHARRHAEAR